MTSQHSPPRRHTYPIRQPRASNTASTPSRPWNGTQPIVEHPSAVSRSTLEATPPSTSLPPSFRTNGVHGFRDVHHVANDALGVHVTQDAVNRRMTQRSLGVHDILGEYDGLNHRPLPAPPLPTPPLPHALPGPPGLASGGIGAAGHQEFGDVAHHPQICHGLCVYPGNCYDAYEATAHADFAAAAAAAASAAATAAAAVTAAAARVTEPHSASASSAEPLSTNAGPVISRAGYNNAPSQSPHTVVSSTTGVSPLAAMFAATVPRASPELAQTMATIPTATTVPMLAAAETTAASGESSVGVVGRRVSFHRQAAPTSDEFDGALSLPSHLELRNNACLLKPTEVAEVTACGASALDDSSAAWGCNNEVSNSDSGCEWPPSPPLPPYDGAAAATVVTLPPRRQTWPLTMIEQELAEDGASAASAAVPQWRAPAVVHSMRDEDGRQRRRLNEAPFPAECYWSNSCSSGQEPTTAVMAPRYGQPPSQQYPPEHYGLATACSTSLVSTQEALHALEARQLSHAQAHDAQVWHQQRLEEVVLAARSQRAQGESRLTGHGNVKEVTTIAVTKANR